MDLESLESFLEVEKHKNFTKAAESLFCTQAAVSMRIKRLETALECGLFKRCGRRVELTREGEIFLPYARQMVNTWKSASEHLLQTRLMEESEIRITSSSTPGTYIIPSLIYLFRQSYPYITVINHIQYTRSAISDVIGGNFFLGIISQPASVGTDVLCCEPLMEDPLVLVVHPQHPWAEKRGILFKEITEETLLISNPNTSLVNYLEKEGRLSLERCRLYLAGNIEAIKRGIRNHQGISIMSEYAVRQELELGLLKQVHLLDHPGLKRQLYTIFRKDTRFKLSTSLFLEFFRKAAEDNRLLSQL